jgi:hypothetical protein
MKLSEFRALHIGDVVKVAGFTTPDNHYVVRNVFFRIEDGQKLYFATLANGGFEYSLDEESANILEPIKLQEMNDYRLPCPVHNFRVDDVM